MFPKFNSGKYAQAIMDFSSDICTKRNPSCSKCVLKNYCKFDLKLEKSYESKKVKKKYSFLYYYLLKNKFFFLKKRSLSGALAGMYEVPGTEWKNNSWPEVPIKLKSIIGLPKTIKYKISNIELQIKIYKVNIINKNDIK